MAPTKWDEQPVPEDDSKYSRTSSMGPQKPVKPGKAPVDPARKAALLRKLNTPMAGGTPVKKRNKQAYQNPYGSAEVK